MAYTIKELVITQIPDNGLSCSVRGYFYYHWAKTPLCEKRSNVYISESFGKERLKCFFIGNEWENQEMTFGYVPFCEEENAKPKYIPMSEDVGVMIQNNDGFIGILVGGPYAYAGTDAVVEGVVIRDSDGLSFSKVTKVTLSKDDKELTIPIANESVAP